MDYENLLLGSKASSLERAQENEASMMQSFQAEAMNRNMYLEQQRTPTATLVSRFGADTHDDIEDIRKAGIGGTIFFAGCMLFLYWAMRSS